MAAMYKGFDQPMSLTNFVNTKDADWWWSALIANTPTISATPARCHHALTS